MLVKVLQNAEHSAILLTFIKLPFVIKIFVLSIFEWPFYTGFTVDNFNCGQEGVGGIRKHCKYYVPNFGLTGLISIYNSWVSQVR